MDKKSILALILIAVIILLLPQYQKMINGNQPAVVQNDISVKDKQSEKEIKPVDIKDRKVEQEKVSEDDISPQKSEEEKSLVEDSFVKNIVQDSVEKIIVIENDLIRAEISNRGGGSLKSFILKKYKYLDSLRVNLISEKLKNDLSLKFTDVSGSYVSTSDILFNCDKDVNEKYLRNKDSLNITYTLNVNHSQIKKVFTFYANSYHFNVDIEFVNSDSLLLNKQYSFGWKNGLPSTEQDQREDYTYSRAYAYMADELENLEVTDEDEDESVEISGTADWVSVRLKYFLVAVSAKNKKDVEGVYFRGVGIKKDDYVQRLYDADLNVNYKGKKASYTVYLGPLDYDILKEYHNNLEELVMNNGAYERTFRFFSLIVLKILQFLHQFIPNYGVVIIIFSILIKLLLTPFTKKSYKSMNEMKVIQPLVNEIKEKYKGDPQRINKETMALYKEYGVNPMGGCLPMLLQMPLLLSLYIVFRSTIQLRGAMFIPGWIPDLSLPDTIFILPFHIPMYGNQFNILPILMAITMMFQSSMTMTDPKQKSMKYVMPVFMLMLFNRFSSGLNLYYTLFNLLTIIQQKMIKTEPIHPKKKGNEKKKNNNQQRKKKKK